MFHSLDLIREKGLSKEELEVLLSEQWKQLLLQNNKDGGKPTTFTLDQDLTERMPTKDGAKPLSKL